MKILHLKAEALHQASGRRHKYAKALAEAGHEVDVWSCGPHPELSVSGFDVVHIHNAPDAFALKWLRFFAQISPKRRPGIVIDIDDDMSKLVFELDLVRRHEIEVCVEQLSRCCDCLPTIVASPAWSVAWNGDVVRNYVSAEQKHRSTVVVDTRIDASVYAGRSNHNAPRGHHRNPCTWIKAPDAMLNSVPAKDLVRALSAFRVGLIPFAGTAFTNTFEPHKLFEYFAAGLTIDLPGELTQCIAAIEEFADHNPQEMPTFESQLPLIEAIYDDAHERRATVDIPLQ